MHVFEVLLIYVQDPDSIQKSHWLGVLIFQAEKMQDFPTL